MEYNSSCNDEDLTLKFSDDESSNSMAHADNYGNIDDIQRDSKSCDSSQLKLSCTQLKQESYHELNDIEFNQIVKKKNCIVVDDGNKQKFASQYLTSSASVSPEKQQRSSQNFEKNNISDKIVNFSKLVNQLLNAKVIIERLCEYSGINEQSAKNQAEPSKSLFRDTVKLYCPKCQTVTVDTHRLYVKKSCSTCESTLRYMCFKCKAKHYKTYENLIRHLHACGLPVSSLEELKSSNFLVKKTEIDFSKEIIRYCSGCNKVDGSCEKWAKRLCRYCDLQLLYQCNKCKAQYKDGSTLLYHMQSKCHPSQYKCNQCDFKCALLKKLRKHVIKVHLRVRSNIEPPTQVPNAKAVSGKLGKPLAENTISQSVKAHTNVDLLDENDSAGERNCNKYVQRYCHTCYKTESIGIEEPLDKICSDCKTAMTFLCAKCNEKHYKRYSYLLLHLDRCGRSADATDILEDGLDRTQLDEEDKDKANLLLSRSQFIVKEFPFVSSTKKWSRHCLECGLVIASNNGCRCTRIEKLLYICKKCNVKCNSYVKIAYHTENYCFPTRQYKCTHCEFSKTSWKRTMIHFKLTHTDLPMIKCKFCSYETRIRSNLNAHIRNVHSEIKKLFHCNNCSYTTKFERNLRRHEKLDH